MRGLIHRSPDTLFEDARRMAIELADRARGKPWSDALAIAQQLAWTHREPELPRGLGAFIGSLGQAVAVYLDAMGADPARVVSEDQAALYMASADHQRQRAARRFFRGNFPPYVALS